MSDPKMALVLIEMTIGKTSVALRFGNSNTIQLLDGWEDLEPAEAAKIAVQIAKRVISADEVASKPYREVTLPASYFKKMEGK